MFKSNHAALRGSVGLVLAIITCGPARGQVDETWADASGRRGGSDVSCLGTDEPGIFYDEGDVFRDEGCTTCGPVFPRLAGCWSAGIEFTILRPYFSGGNLAFTTLTSDGDTFESFADTEFAYNTELAPRVWVHVSAGDALGFRATYWQFDHGAAPAVGTPPDNGFGSIIPPSFDGVDLSTTIPGSQFLANTDLNAYTIDLEFTKTAAWGSCGWVTGVGLRYAEVQQRYLSELRSAADVLQSTLDFSHLVKGIGPTVSVRTERPLTGGLSVFGLARGSLVFGDNQSLLIAIEDQDLDAQLTTNSTTRRDGFLPIGDLQVGLHWNPRQVGIVIPYLHLAMESQLWGGAGNGSSDAGNLGFFGLNVSLGFDF